MLLWDGEQIDAYTAGEPVPPLPAQDSPDDLLDRNEAANLTADDIHSHLGYPLWAAQRALNTATMATMARH